MARVPIGNVPLKNRALNVGYAQWCDRRSGGSKAPAAGAAESATRPMTIFCAEAKDCARRRDNLNRSELS
jgi:hypothetical protein